MTEVDFITPEELNEKFQKLQIAQARYQFEENARRQQSMFISEICYLTDETILQWRDSQAFIHLLRENMVNNLNLMKNVVKSSISDSSEKDDNLYLDQTYNLSRYFRSLYTRTIQANLINSENLRLGRDYQEIDWSVS